MWKNRGFSVVNIFYLPRFCTIGIIRLRRILQGPVILFRFYCFLLYMTQYNCAITNRIYFNFFVVGHILVL